MPSCQHSQQNAKYTYNRKLLFLLSRLSNIYIPLISTPESKNLKSKRYHFAVGLVCYSDSLCRLTYGLENFTNNEFIKDGKRFGFETDLTFLNWAARPPPLSIPSVPASAQSKPEQALASPAYKPPCTRRPNADFHPCMPDTKGTN